MFNLLFKKIYLKNMCIGFFSICGSLFIYRKYNLYKKIFNNKNILNLEFKNNNNYFIRVYDCNNKELYIKYLIVTHWDKKIIHFLSDIKNCKLIIKYKDKITQIHNFNGNRYLINN